MLFREATVADIKQIQEVRNSVKENMLSDPALVTDEDCVVFLTQRGKGWVCEVNGKIIGFAIADLWEHNIWALFLRPQSEGAGIGKQLHHLMMDWYFSQTREPVWLGTAPDTRAAKFYERNGWKQTGMHGKEIKFEMTYNDWQKINHI
jgi:GNAT superfamily N-acetyltransferase